MARKSEDEVMEEVYERLFGDMDRLESSALFDEEEAEQSGPENSKPGAGEVSGVAVEIKPIMAAADTGKPEKEEDEDKLKGISDMSPLMEQLHGKR